ncbi:Uncharacterized protein LOK49_LG13G01141 [Camellia lanceoleosa]|uniref:Uncharacterized protein n=1 Tax=Camellia lanceoleosa TaxID=1840588 RepID=A0ACC0FHR7_9ERIC|nr:Uncharacterized protein LOK49_LG13G01141 [Camellia lanceoleosa]
MASLSETSLCSSDRKTSYTCVRTFEEEDHLSRSTKKIKGANVNDDDTMLDNPAGGLEDLLTDDEFVSDDEEIEDLTNLDSETLGIPRISLPKKLLAKIQKPWKNCLIIKLLGKKVGYKLLMSKIRKIWDLQGDFEAIDLDSGFLLLKFQMKEDCSYVYTGGPWIVLDHYLTIRKWTPDFKSSAAKETSSALWVQFPQLPIEYYDEKVLFHIAKTMGKPLKINLNTATSSRGKYARVCIEMDLKKPLISLFAIGKYTYSIEYEHLHTFCFTCSRVGHRRKWCSEKPPSTVNLLNADVSTNQIMTVANDFGNKEGPT